MKKQDSESFYELCKIKGLARCRIQPQTQINYFLWYADPCPTCASVQPEELMLCARHWWSGLRAVDFNMKMRIECGCNIGIHNKWDSPSYVALQDATPNFSSAEPCTYLLLGSRRAILMEAMPYPPRRASPKPPSHCNWTLYLLLL